MIINKKLSFPYYCLSLVFLLFSSVNLLSQKQSNSFTFGSAQSQQSSSSQQIKIQGDPKVFNNYKFIHVEDVGLNEDPYWLKNGKETLLTKIYDKLSGFGIPILKFTNGAKNCDVLYCYFGKSINSEMNRNTYFADIYFLDCNDNVVLYIPSKSIRPNIDMFTKEFQRLATKGAEVYYKAYVDTMFQDYGFYQYSYQSPVEAVKSNPIIAQETTIQNNTSSTIQQKTEQPKNTIATPVISDVDINIPLGAKPNTNRFALIIGNEDYHSNQLGLRAEADVEFAANDATIFKEYAIKVLGVPEDNMIFITNAKLVEMNRSVEKLSLLSKATGGEGEIFFYYAGHGYPDELTKEAYIIPVDVSGADLKYALKLKDIYNTLTAYQSKRVTIFMDACFSGGAREAPLLANRGIKIKPKETNLTGNQVVFCATSNDQTAMAYKAKGHGMFTYFLLKKLQETKGDVTYGALYESLQKQVGVKSILENSMEQTPTMVTAPGLGGSWKEWKIKE